jgi:hypothetical protein
LKIQPNQRRQQFIFLWILKDEYQELLETYKKTNEKRKQENLEKTYQESYQKFKNAFPDKMYKN